MKAKDVTFIGLLVAALVSGGFALYLISRVLPLPGAKFLVLAPYLALAMGMGIDRLRSAWSMTIVSVVFGVVISIFTPVMGLTIVAAGLASDASALVLRGGALTTTKVIGSAAFYPAWSIALALTVTNHLTGNALFGSLGFGPLLVAAGLAYALGAVGAGVGLKILARIRLATEPAGHKVNLH